MLGIRYLPKFRDTDFYRLYNLKDEKSRGRAMILANVLMCSIGNIFISGTFHTAFLAANGIDIVRVGIIAFVPYLCAMLSLLTPRVFAKIKRRRWIILATHFLYYGFNVLATTVMPMFVEDPGARTFWFAVFLFLGNGINSVFGTGVSAWTVNFLPEGRDRNIYFSVSNIVTNVMGTLTAIGAALAADALAGSPRQTEILTTLRLAALVVLLIGGCLQILVPKEYPYERSTGDRVRFRDVITIPMRNRKFILTVLAGYLWGFICFINSSTWTYYLLDTVKLPYVMTYIPSVVMAAGSIFLMGLCRRIYNRFGWHKMFFINVLTILIFDSSAIFITAKTVWLFVVYSIIGGLSQLILQLTTSNTFYLNLPAADADHYFNFHGFASSLFTLLGGVFGTWLLSVMEKPDGSCLFACIGLDFYPSQILVAIKLVLMAGLLVYIRRITPLTQPDRT